MKNYKIPIESVRDQIPRHPEMASVMEIANHLGITYNSAQKYLFILKGEGKADFIKKCGIMFWFIPNTCLNVPTVEHTKEVARGI